MAMIDDLFIKLDSAKKDRYTKESGDFCELLFATIGKTFDREKELKFQMKGLTQSEYIVMRDFLAEDIISDLKAGIEKESSVKVIFSKLLESFILKDLEVFFDYNIYNDKERLSEKMCIDKAIHYLYTLQPTGPFIKPSEIHLKVDSKLFTDEKEIKDTLCKNIKKDKGAILKNNIRFNKSLIRNSEKCVKEEWKDMINGRYSKSLRAQYTTCLCTEYIRDVSSYSLEDKPMKVILAMVPFITHSLDGLPITDKSVILRNFLLRKEKFYFQNHKILRRADTKTKVFLDINCSNMKSISTYTWEDMKTKVRYHLDPKIMQYYNDILAYNYEKIENIQCKLGRTYKGEECIAKYIASSTTDNVFKVKYKDWKTLLLSKNFGLFFILNQDVISFVSYMEEVVEPSTYILRPTGFNTIALSEYIDNFLEVIRKDYKESYTKKKILDLNTGFIKGKDPYIKKELANQKKNFEEMIRQDAMLTKLFPTSLED